MKKKINVLLVEDDPLTHKQIRYFFDTLPYTLIEVADSGKTGIQKAFTIKPDLILMDVIMETPHAGIDAAKTIKAEIDIPIVFLTASQEDETLIKALQTNPYGYLVKPINRESLQSTIEISLLRHRYEKKLIQYQQALEESEAMFRGIFSAMENGYYRLSKKRKIILVNPAMVTMLGYTSENQLIGKNFTELGCIDTESRNRFFEILRQNGEISLFESVWTTHTDRVINIIENAHTVYDDKGTLLYYEGTIQNITRIKELEIQLRHSQKMEVIGTLSGRIAHEINNRMTTILGYADLCVLRLKPEEKLHKYAKAIQKNARITADVMRQLLNLSRKSKNQPFEFDLNNHLKTREEIIIQILGKNIELKLKLNPQPTNVYADTRQIEHVIINLVINARDSMPEGGKLTIETSHQIIGSDSKWKYEIPLGSYSSLTISDTGTGIPNHVIPNIFDPFFTTKDPSVGTGLGLSIVKDIIQENHGFISVNSKEGKGTTFHLLIPATREISQQLR